MKRNKKQYLSLLLLADEQENMVDRYLEHGTMYVLDDKGIKAECVVTDEGNGILEIKNIATDPDSQRRGYGKALIDFISSKYQGKYSVLQAGTGDSPLTVPFYEKCGFSRSHVVENFFTENYDHPIPAWKKAHRQSRCCRSVPSRVPGRRRESPARSRYQSSEIPYR